MAITIILIGLAIQRWFQIDHYVRKSTWFDRYAQWLESFFGLKSWWPTLLGVLIILAPALIIYILVATLVCHLLTFIGYYLLGVAVFWYALDARPLNANDTQHTRTQIIKMAYERLFALIFWLLILGSTGVVLYTLVVYLCRWLAKRDDENGQKMLPHALAVQGVLDWVPTRLLGLTFALVGQFSPTFIYWYRNVFTGIASNRDRMAQCGLITLGLETTSDHVPEPEKVPALEALINRSLWVWLVVIALMTIARWVG